jgi:phytoene desaturase
VSHAVVIGAGLAGLSAAAALAVRGHAVTLVEARPTVGGKAERVEAAGARVDVGPTVLTDLRPLRTLFELAGLRLEDALSLLRVEPALLATFPGGVELRVHADPDRMRASVAAALGSGAAADWARLSDLGARAGRLADHFYRHGDVAGPADLARFLLAGGVARRDVLPFARHRSLARLLEAAVDQPELRRLLRHFARFLGLDPEDAPAVALVVPHLVATAGVHHPSGGMTALAEAILRLAVKHGAVLEAGTGVAGLETTGGCLSAVRTAAGRRIPADACVAAVEAGATAAWLADRRLAARVARRRPTLAARVAWWVVEGVPPRRAHHALHFGADPGEEPLYVAVPTVTDPTLAPGGASVVYALLHGPVGAPATPALAAGLRARVAVAGQWPGGRVLADGVAGGTAPCYGYAVGPGLFRSFQLSQRVGGTPNLFLAGGSVFPGPGVANVLRSGLRAAALADAVLGRAR